MKYSQKLQQSPCSVETQCIASLHPNIENIAPDPRQFFVSFPAKRRKDLDVIFLREEQGFNGADADFSLSLGKNRSLWLFGDTLVGPRFTPKQFQMPRNAIGILNHSAKAKFVVPALAGKTNPTKVGTTNLSPATTLKFTYYWQNKNGKAESFFPDPKPGQWLWPGSACIIHKTIYYFLHSFQTDNKHSKYDSFKFRRMGFYILRTDNPNDLPDKWRVEVVNTPKLCHSVVCGVSCFPGEDGFLYLWGPTRGHRQKGTVVARCPFEFLEDNKGKGWEYLVERKSCAIWSYSSHYLRPLFSHRAPEMSLHYLKRQKIFLTVYGLKKNSIGLRIARNLEGPWSNYQEIYSPNEHKQNKHYFSYAPKAHPELILEESELLITYITNSLYPKDLFEDKRLYYPKFLVLKMLDHENTKSKREN